MSPIVMFFVGVSKLLLPHTRLMRLVAFVALPGVFLVPASGPAYVSLRVVFLSLSLILFSLSAMAVAFDQKFGPLGCPGVLEERTAPAIASLVRNTIAILYLLIFFFLVSLPIQSFLAG